MNHAIGLIAFLAQTPTPPANRGELTRSALMLWLGLAVGGLVLIAVVGTIFASIRKRREARARDFKRPAKPIRDAWEESARRLEVEPPDDPDDDDLRIRE